MRRSFHSTIALLAAGLGLGLFTPRVQAGVGERTGTSDDGQKAAAEAAATAATKESKTKEEPPPVSLLDALRDGRVAVRAEGRDDGRINVSVTNRTHKTLRVVLPPGIIAQGATGQMGMMGGMGMGGMGGMGMGGGMGGGMGRMGGMGGGMGGMGRMGGMMGGRTMPPMMGMMMLARMIMYFCGDYDSWDMRSLMIGMGRMGGMGMGMGGMGMGGMGGMGMMGGGMRSVPPTGLPFADLKPGQTRQLPTRMVSLEPPDPQGRVRFPGEGEAFRIADISETSDNPRVQKALRRLAAEKAATPVAQLVMWNVAAGMDWETIAGLSQGWANRHELTLARDFVDRLDHLSEWETGRIFFEVSALEPAADPKVASLKKAVEGKIVLGLRAEPGVPARPDRPSLACRVGVKGNEVQVQVAGSDASARTWVSYGKFTVAARGDGAAELADAIAEGLIGRLVRTQLIKGSRVKGKLTHRIKIQNGSPLRLNGLAAVGMSSPPDEPSRVLTGISVPPRQTMTIPASEDVVNRLGLKHGIRVTALDLSGL